MTEENLVKVQIKGVREGLHVSVGDGPWEHVEASLLNHIQQKESFFKGARIALEVGSQILHAAELGALRDKLSDHGVSLWAVISDSPTTERSAQNMGLATRLSSPKADRVVKALDTSLAGDSAVMVRRTLRSGFRIETEGHVVVIGDVNPGAQIIAGGNIVVWGRLRGMVHAGCAGDEQAMICALEMSPTHLRIADVIAANVKKKKNPQPEVAYISDGQVVAENWNTKERGK